MSRTMRFSFHTLVWVLTLPFCRAAFGQAAWQVQPLAISFSPSEPAYTVQEPVYLVMKIENRMDFAMRLELGFNRIGNLSILLLGPNGAVSDLIPRHPPEGISRVGAISIEPGNTYEQRILLSQFYAFPGPGHYRIRAGLTHRAAKSLGAEALILQPQDVGLTILPRDASRLTKVCDRLASEAVSPNAEAALDAGLALSYVDDLVAVPFLERIATGGPFKVVIRPKAISGLARISLTWGQDNVFSRLSKKDSELEATIIAEYSIVRRGDDRRRSGRPE